MLILTDDDKKAIEAAIKLSVDQKAATEEIRDFFNKANQNPLKTELKEFIKKELAPKLTEQQLFNFTRAMMLAQIGTTFDPLVRTSNIAAVLYTIFAEKINYTPGEGEAEPPFMIVLNKLIKESIPSSEQDKNAAANIILFALNKKSIGLLSELEETNLSSARIQTIGQELSNIRKSEFTPEKKTKIMDAINMENPLENSSDTTTSNTPLNLTELLDNYNTKLLNESRHPLLDISNSMPVDKPDKLISGLRDILKSKSITGMEEKEQRDLSLIILSLIGKSSQKSKNTYFEPAIEAIKNIASYHKESQFQSIVNKILSLLNYLSFNQQKQDNKQNAKYKPSPTFIKTLEKINNALGKTSESKSSPDERTNQGKPKP